MSKKLIAVAALTVVAMMAVPAASASAATVNGACTISGSATFGSPLTAQPGPNSYSFSGSGTCSGTLDGQAFVNSPASASASGSGTLGCSAALSQGGTGTLTVNGTSVGFHVDLAGGGTEVVFALTGNSGGAGVGHASFITGAAGGLSGCAGAGVSSLPFTIQATAANLSG
jgi:hypothetical protein